MNLGPANTPSLQLVDANLVVVLLRAVDDGGVDRVFDDGGVVASSDEGESLLLCWHSLPACNNRLTDGMRNPHGLASVLENAVASARGALNRWLPAVLGLEELLPPRIL